VLLVTVVGDGLAAMAALPLCASRSSGTLRNTAPMAPRSQNCPGAGTEEISQIPVS
jgi:hypothetical protein